MPLTPVELTDEQLNDLCIFLTNTEYIYYPIATDFFKDLYNTGCRPNELLDMLLWTYISPTNIILTPLKANSPRVFSASQLTAGLVYAIQNSIKPYQGLTLRQLTSVMKKILPVIEVITDIKSAIDYMFRYNAIKILHEAGATDADIQAIYGWSTSALAISYYSQRLFSIPALPPYIGNRILDDSGNFLIDDSNNFILQ